MNYEVKQYISSSGKAYFGDWFDKLAPDVAELITAAIHRLELGHESNVKFLRMGIWEYKIYSGPGYRIYYGKIGKSLILILAGGTKRRQNKDIELAIKLFHEYKSTNLH